MKFIHLSDLHLGRSICGYSLIEDQEHIINSILKIADEEKPQLVLVSGDVYDKLSPSAEAVMLLDRFLTELVGRDIKTLLIAGNHDSAERIAFGARIMDKSGVYFSPVYNGSAEKLTFSDEFGEVDFYLLPYLRTADVRRFFPEKEIANVSDAVKTAIEAMEIDTSRRNVILSHQFAEGGQTSDSERGAVGGTDAVPAEVYADFDYAALGHLHMPQKIGKDSIRYGGTPLKYSLSEAEQKKGVTVCELGEKGTDVKITVRTLDPLRDLRVLRGSFEELISGGTDDFVHIVLTDEERVPDAQKKLRNVYGHLIGVSYEREQQREDLVIDESANVEKVSPLKLFEDFFESANGKPMKDEQREVMTELINSIWS